MLEHFWYPFQTLSNFFSTPKLLCKWLRMSVLYNTTMTPQRGNNL